MTMELKYSAALTGASFMLFEFKQIATLKENGLSDDEIRHKVLTENLFQYEKLSSLKRGLPYILQRVNALDDYLRKYVLQETLESSKLVNLYAIMKTDRLFFEFMSEVMQEKLSTHNYTLEKKDINSYFAIKSEQDTAVASWSDSTVEKLQSVFRKILYESGILTNYRTGELNRLIVDEQIKNHLHAIGDGRYLQVIGESR
ncbi:DUF1819 family protein [Sporosarcina thermotolerans]|uniref:DUF1819 family protein n=1 Tax=Sporosarcina thermotolerans TaxID=633404 RepID=A0AAW9AAU6_9BACL|nr:DUF1819 family protein [Sporosarcina thermotolerans]MDW0118617.1 DUF1819 family protein [Sporosarcina thermotolerans]WHT49589.1 DUF1819 family protein [Sporosarcina thermotolerans]